MWISDIVMGDARTLKRLNEQGQISTDQLVRVASSHPNICTCPSCLVVATFDGPTSLVDGKMNFGIFPEDVIAVLVRDPARMEAWRKDCIVTHRMAEDPIHRADRLEAELAACRQQLEEVIARGVRFTPDLGADSDPDTA